MSIGKIFAYLAAGVLIILGVLFLWSAGSVNNANPIMSIIIGLITIAVGVALIWLANRKGPAPVVQQNVTMKVDLPADVKSEALKCQSCGGTLGPDDIKMVAGAPWVVCPYCHTTYQLTEEPKW